MQIKRTVIEYYLNDPIEDEYYFEVDADNLFDAVMEYQTKILIDIRTTGIIPPETITTSLPNKNGFNTLGVGWKIEPSKITYVSDKYLIAIFECCT